MATATQNRTEQAQTSAPLSVESLANKAIVVSGGTAGIGRATARMLVGQGARVLIFGRKQKELDEALGFIHSPSARGQVHGITGDQARYEDVQRIFREADQKLGGVDILVNNAAAAAGDIMKDFDQVKYLIDVNLVGYMACCREAIQRMRKRGNG